MCDPSDHSLLIMFIPCDFCNPHLWFLIFYSFCSQLFPAATLIVRNKTQTSCFFFCFFFFNFFPFFLKKKIYSGDTLTNSNFTCELKTDPSQERRGRFGGCRRQEMFLFLWGLLVAVLMLTNLWGVVLRRTRTTLVSPQLKGKDNRAARRLYAEFDLEVWKPLLVFHGGVFTIRRADLSQWNIQRVM